MSLLEEKEREGGEGVDAFDLVGTLQNVEGD